MTDATARFSVNLWGSCPGANDDCWTGIDTADREEAEAMYADPDMADGYFARSARCPGTWIEIDGPGIHEERELHPGSHPPDDDNDWRREFAMQQGMGLGIAAYNDAIGSGLDF